MRCRTICKCLQLLSQKDPQPVCIDKPPWELLSHLSRKAVRDQGRRPASEEAIAAFQRVELSLAIEDIEAGRVDVVEAGVGVSVRSETEVSRSVVGR